MSKRWILLPVALVATILPVDSAAALTYSWSWAGRWTDVSPDNRTFAYVPATSRTGMQSVHELSARRDRGDRSKGRAEAAVKTRFDSAVFADHVQVSFFGKVNEADNDPLATLKVFVHCVAEVEDDEWVFVGRKEVPANTTPVVLNRAITTDDCETQTMNGLMLQVRAGERGDRRRRTAFLRRADLLQGVSPVWTEDFTTQ